MKLNTENLKKVKEHLKGYVPKGDIKDFPIEVIEWMCYNQLEQQNEIDVEVFEKEKFSTYEDGGFDWRELSDEDFCPEIIANKNFKLFFEMYPNVFGEPMRYFYITYKIEAKDFFYCGCFTYTSELHPTLKELEQRAKEVSKYEENPIIITYIHEFKTKEDYENFIK